VAVWSKTWVCGRSIAGIAGLNSSEDVNLLHTPARYLHVGRYPSQYVSVLGPATALSPSFLLAQAIFEPNLFPYKYSNIFDPNHPSYLSAYDDGTECSETSA